MPASKESGELALALATLRAALQELQVKHSFVEEQMRHHDDVLIEYGRRIETLEQEFARLAEFARRKLDGGEIGEHDDPPPHY